MLNEFGLPQHIDDFRVYYRVSRNLFEIILQDIFANLLLLGTGPYDAIEPTKQLLVCLWYLANMSSMRQVGHIFNLSKSIVHTVVIRILEALQQLAQKILLLSKLASTRDYQKQDKLSNERLVI